MKHKLLYGILTLIIILLGVLLVNCYSKNKTLEEYIEITEERYLYDQFYLYSYSFGSLKFHLENEIDSQTLSIFLNNISLIAHTSMHHLRAEKINVFYNLNVIEKDLQQNDTTEKREALYELIDQFQLDIEMAILDLKGEQLEEAINEFNQELVEYQRVHGLGD
ncbi:hypothetical protein BTR22_04535 [Alkalihalophilus pseudofirmus]|uniref:hypothetical protein n=1 Tax=Alkalihalophilus pseudofirmus TaxID=79885 RepID=UPI00095206F1|nr:hypothetical protein BTR22_04535 [Alkalihalophilus pseudofirmus]